MRPTRSRSRFDAIAKNAARVTGRPLAPEHPESIQNRDGEAIQVKLDELLRISAGARGGSDTGTPEVG
jgi:low affinity Fe/Cu permease